SEEALAAGVPIVTEQQVGTILVSSLDLPSSQSQQFLNQVNRAIVIAVLIAAAIALALGALLTWQITRPLRELTGAAEAIAAGDLSRRVEAAPSDEIGDLARAFNKMSAQLERAEQLRRQMTADIAHELRTPLAVIRGNVDALEDGVFPMTTEALAPIREKTALLERLVNDLHELTLLEAGQLSLNRQPTNMVALTHHTVDAFRATAERQSVKLETEFDASVPIADVDPQRIEQVLVNLLSNALRHTPAGGTVTVRGTTEQEATLRISITDTGPGIPAEALPNVFERFYRVDHEGRARPTSGSGAGLGLAVARSIVNTHGGSMGAKSPAGAGATFWFTVPVQRPDKITERPMST
ncbi:MAG: ATP-binding protein, partial [Candidatus Promineifilaceae bacterium]|nr:ATP-binding protein [Candidatus Promineifilaceae bacterium]